MEPAKRRCFCGVNTVNLSLPDLSELLLLITTLDSHPVGGLLLLLLVALLVVGCYALRR